MSAAAEVVRERTAAHPRIARALPAWVYRHPEMTRLEIERILKPTWQIVCHLNSLPKSGDYVTFDLGPETVFALRARPRGRVARVSHRLPASRRTPPRRRGQLPGDHHLSLPRLVLPPGRQLSR